MCSSDLSGQVPISTVTELRATGRTAGFDASIRTGLHSTDVHLRECNSESPEQHTPDKIRLRIANTRRGDPGFGCPPRTSGWSDPSPRSSAILVVVGDPKPGVERAEVRHWAAICIIGMPLHARLRPRGPAQWWTAESAAAR